MDILISVAGKVAEYTVAPIGRQAGYLLCYKGNFKELADHVDELRAARERLNHRIVEEKGNGREIERDVGNWLKEVDEVIKKANRLQEDPRHAKVGCSGWPLFPNLILRHRLSRDATKIAKDVVKMKGKGNFDRVGYLPPLLDGVAFSISSATRGGEKLKERESFKEGVVKAIKDPNSRIIGVYGLGGVGKTTLVKEVAQVAKQDNLFEKVVIAHVSQTPDIKTIQGEIADRLDLRFQEETVAGRADRLRQRIKAEKTILIILDDIWTRLDLEKVGIPYGYDHNGCKLLLTSRNQEVLQQQMDAQKDFTFGLEILNEAEAWSLFQFMAGDVVNDNNLKVVATQVAKKCSGLPLCLVMVARTLKDNGDVKDWKNALRELENNDHAGLDATYSAFKLSYNSLENGEMKSLFLLFAVLQGSNVEYIFKVAMGLNILKRTKTVDDARSRLYRKIESLKASCLLHDGSTSRKLQMHDLVHDLAISIACKDQHVFVRKGEDEFKEWPTKDFLKRCQQIILRRCHIHKLPQRLDCPNVKLFYLYSTNRSLEIPDTIFEGMGSLKVLDLSCLNLSALPTSFRFLTALQTLCLDQCVLENMNAIEALKNLQFLSFWKSSMIKLPSEIGKLTQLRMLDLSYSGIEVIPPNIISSLTKLEELYMGNTSIKWEDEISANQNENASLAELQQLSNLTALELQIREARILPRDLQLMFEKLERYRIAIGDVWDWSDIEDKTLKTLMLKLGTNIDLEHGIKALIKGVENLYLDEVEGIQNMLYQLNWEGFPWMQHLHIQNNANMKHIVDSAERNQDQDSFPKLETLVLLNLRNLEQICHGPLAVNSFGKLSVIKVKNCVQLKYLLSFSMVKKRLSQLSKIEVCQCNSMKKIVLEDNDSSEVNDIPNEKIEFPKLHSLTLEHLPTLENFFSYELTHSITKRKYQRVDTSVSAQLISAQVAFPNLDTLKLSSLNLKKIWDDNQHSLDKLTNLIVENCVGLKYLFSSTAVGSFMNLKHLEISNCPLMEEIIAIEETNHGISASEEVGFFKLEIIILKDMGNLKTIWHRQFEKLKTLQADNCEKVVVVFPSSMQKTYNNLEMLEVTHCALVEEIFELTSNENSSVDSTTRLKGITLHGLPNLKKIWNRDPQGILNFHNLENVNLSNCRSLEYLFPLSVATCCSHLKELGIKLCGNMKEIVEKKKDFVCTTPLFEFNQLNTLLLLDSNKLKGFYAGNHTLKCPTLRTIDVSGCAKLNLYKTVSTISPETCRDGKLPVLTQQVFIVEEVIPNLEKLRINQRDANVILQAQNLGALFTKLKFLGLSNYNNKNEEAAFPYWFLQNVRTLESLAVEWSSFKKIFQEERQVHEKIHTRLKILELNHLPKLQHICEEGSPIDPVLEFLEHLHILNCPGLKNLVPSSVTFNYLTCLRITNCNGLLNLITSSTARSLGKLIMMAIKDCNSLEEIITGEENVGIAFTSLQILMLECLPNLNKFCSSKCFLKFPLLEQVVVSECPRMKIFSKGNTSTPILRKVKISENDEEWHWMGNLNDTIKNMFEDKVAFCQFKHLTMSDYPELKDLWYGQLHHSVFCNLKSLVVQGCDFLSHVLFPSNVLQVLRGLEDLEVRDYDSLETVFDVKDMKSEETLIKQNTQLKRLTLSSLPKLKHIWNEDPCEIISFGNLCTVKVSMCQNLLYIFSLPLCQDLEHLINVLEIVSCGVEEIVAMEEGSMKCSFNFPQLTNLVLCLLTNLKSFYPGKHTLECPSLKILNVYRCEALRMFSFNYLDFQQQPVPVDENHDMLFRQPLFSIEKLSPNLEQLAINGTDALRILSGYRQGNTFHKIEFLRLQCFHETPAIFLNDFHAIFPSFETLQVRNSSFEILFATKATTGHLSLQISKQIRNLWLSELENLKYIWEEEFPSYHPVLQDLEVLAIWDCPSLINLAPSSASFTNLTYLHVNNCKELVYLITSSTAKSLVQLTTLKIINCEKMLEVVKIEEEKAEEDIIFENLEYMEFTSLSSFKSFCYGKHMFTFPSLLDFVVKGCPQMKTFSSGVTVTPFLTAIEVENQQIRWKGDLNTTIEQLFIEQKFDVVKFSAQTYYNW